MDLSRIDLNLLVVSTRYKDPVNIWLRRTVNELFHD